MKLKIAYPVIKAGTGSDVYYRFLEENLNSELFFSKIFFLEQAYEFYPGKAFKFLQNLSDFDIIHTNIEYGGLFKTRSPLVLSAHHCVLEKQYQSYTSLLQKIYHYGWLYFRMKRAIVYSDIVICPSNYTRSAFVKVYPKLKKKFKVIWLGIDTNIFYPDENVKRKNTHVLCVGTPSRRKGFDLLYSLAEKMDGTKIIYVGAPLEKQFYHRNIIWKYGVTQQELVTLYRTSACVFSLSRLEGFGYTIAEAMACNSPVVCFQTSSLVEVIGDAPGAKIVAMDDIPAIVSALKFFLLSTNTIYNKNSQRIIKNFSKEIYLNKMITLYSELKNNI